MSQPVAPLAGRRVLVVGASRGIGAAVAHRMAADGAAVTLVGRDGMALENVLANLAEGDHRCVVADLSLPDGRSDLFAALSPNLNHLANPHHVVVLALRVRRPWAKLDSMLGEDLVRAFAENTEYIPPLISALLPAQRACGFGRWIALSSVMAEIGGAGQAAYVAQKCALEAMMRTLAIEEGRHGITANVVAPGFIRTEGTELAYQESVFQALSQSNVLGRAGTPEEVAHVVAMLAHPEGGYITGATIPVSAGVQLGWSIDQVVKQAVRSVKGVDGDAV